LPHAGGSREYYNNIYRNLVELDDSQVTILTKKVPGWEEFDRMASSKLFHVKRRFKPLRSWKYHELLKGVGPFVDAMWHALRYSPDIMHAGDLYPPGLIALILKKILGLPYVVYCHGEEITQTDRYRYQPRMRDRIYKGADGVVANSDFAVRNLLRIGVCEERICKITPGVDCIRFRPMPPNTDLQKRHGLEGKVVVLTVARLIPRKGHVVVMKAFARLCNEFPDAHYLIVGTGPEESRLRQLAMKLNLGSRVTFAGYVSADQLPDVYSLCDIMVMANRQEADGDVEGFGIVFLEANAAGKPVIGGRTGGAVEAIEEGKTGFLVNPDDDQELAGVLRQLVSNRQLREKLGQAGIRRVRSDFTWKSRAEALRKLNSRILSSQTTPARSPDLTASTPDRNRPFMF
jgi:phosphatidylinositol alpha-1,6-mannosyltransferase